MLSDSFENAQLSLYQPSKEVADFISKEVKPAYSAGQLILDKTWPELNDLSVIDRMNRDQMTFNAYVDEGITDEADSWKWRGTRSTARKKAIALHAHITSQYVIPIILAQNDQDEEDEIFSEIMYDIVEWMTYPENSNYRSSFLLATQGMLVNPITYLGADWNNVSQTIKIRSDNGKLTKQEIVDEVLSGFNCPVYSADQILINNAYEQNIQRQRSLIKRKWISYSEAKAKYGEHDDFDFVAPGIRTIYNDATGLFYDIRDDMHINLVAEETYLNRREDTEVCFLGGIYMGNPSVDDNPMKHRDNKNAPKYDLVGFGYHRINEHFYYYKSLMNEVYWDDELIDAQWEYVMNREFLDLSPPTAISGQGDFDEDIIFPGGVTAFADKDTKIQQILPPLNLNAGLAAIAAVDSSMADASVNDVQQGQLPEKDQKAYNVARAETNAKILLSGVGKTMGASVAAYGSLMCDIAIHHVTVPEVVELASGKTKLKYKQFVLNNKSVKGKNVTKKISFKEDLMYKDMSDSEEKYANAELLTKSGYPDNKVHLYEVNPELFARMKYLSKVEADTMLPENADFQKALMTNLYTLLRQDPLVSPEQLVRKLLTSYFKGDAEDLINKQASSIMGQPAPNIAQNSLGGQVQKKVNGAVLGGIGTNVV